MYVRQGGMEILQDQNGGVTKYVHLQSRRLSAGPRQIEIEAFEELSCTATCTFFDLRLSLHEIDFDTTTWGYLSWSERNMTELLDSLILKDYEYSQGLRVFLRIPGKQALPKCKGFHNRRFFVVRHLQRSQCHPGGPRSLKFGISM